MKLYNTLTRAKEEFKPLDGNTVRLYSCGPTVYYYAHIGNLRAYLFMDNLRRVLKYNGYDLKHAMNITDVGHLESDADEGEDKMAKAAKRENKDPYEIAQFYTDLFLKDIDSLNIDRPEIICKATDHIKEMEQFVLEIMKNGYAYETANTIYFDTAKLEKYGMLSRANIEEQKAGARVEFDTEKKNPTDFALWIKAPENHIMKWETFWGLCYPGWHIECSAMSNKYLGEQFDIHTGGIDHIPIHHENEIAQSLGCKGVVPAKFWMHCDFLQVDGGKMSKSLNNLYTLKDLADKGYESLAYRLFNFSSHYRSKINFTDDSIKAAQVSLNRIREGALKHKLGTETISAEIIAAYEAKFLEAINDDLNMPVALSVIWDVIKNEAKSKDLYNLLLKFDQVMGLDLEKVSDEKKELELPDDIKEIVEKRLQARAEKQWALSDQYRDELKEKGYLIEDSKEGYNIKKI